MDEPWKTGALIPTSINEQRLSEDADRITKTTRLFRRGPFGKKQYFTPEGSSSAQFYVVNPTPHKHANTWRPKLYRGDHPKYDDTSRLVARARRAAFWARFRIEIGDGVAQKAENETRVWRETMHRRLNKFRKCFCLGPKPPSKPLLDPEPVTGWIEVVHVRRPGFFTRSLQFEVNGETYTWKGTRRFLPKQVGTIKGIAHDLKLVDAAGNLIATFEKDRWISFKVSEKTGQKVNKNRSRLGDLCFRAASGVGMPPAIDSETDQRELQMKIKEDIFAFTIWIALEAEHRFRYKVLDILAEIGETIGG